MRTLSGCVERHRPRLLEVDFHTLHIDALDDLIRRSSALVREGGSGADAGRATIWFANAEYCNRGIAPAFRSVLGPITHRPNGDVAAMWKADAPHLDLQWLVFRWPHHELQPRLASLHDLRLITERGESPLAPIVASKVSMALGTMERFCTGKGQIRYKCDALRMLSLQHLGMRSLAALGTKAKRKIVVQESRVIRDKLKSLALKIPQLTPHRISRRVEYWKAWKLAGGGTHWTDAADVFAMITGSSVSPQAVKDIIENMQAQKIVRRRRKRLVVPGVIPPSS